MGWTFQYNRVTDPKAELIRKIETVREGSPQNKVRHISKRGNVFYLAVQITPADPENHSYGVYEPNSDGSYTIGVVAETRRDGHGGWGYKFTEETQGPRLTDAPIKLINMLSSLPMFPEENTGAEYATKWRANCINRTISRRLTKLNNGDLIRFDNPLSFDDDAIGVSRTFLVSIERWMGQRARTVFICQDTQKRCRITGFSRLPFTKLNAGV